MRSRYAAYAVTHADHLFRTWHPRTRPEHVLGTPDTTWTGQEILDVVDGGPDDSTGVVEVRASYTDASGPGVVHERSSFQRRATVQPPAAGVVRRARPARAVALEAGGHGSTLAR